MSWTNEQKQTLQDNAGKMAIKELSLLIGKSEGCVSSYAARKGISISFVGHGPKKKISDETVKEIKRLLGLGNLTNREIGRRTNVDESYVASIKAGRIRCGKQKIKGPSIQESIAAINKIFC